MVKHRQQSDEALDLYREQVGRNICHGSDSVENAEREIALWFDPAELIDHESAMKDWIYE